MTEPFTDIDPPLYSRRALLRPVMQSDYAYLYGLAMTRPNIALWRYRGSTPSPERFAESLWADVLAQFVVVEGREMRPAGLVYCYQPDFRNGHAHLALIMEDIPNRPLVGADAMLLFVNYLFSNWPFRKLYGEALELNQQRTASAAGRLYTEEGRLRAHEFHAGQYWDVVITAMYREVWAREVERRLERIACDLPELLTDAETRA